MIYITRQKLRLILQLLRSKQYACFCDKGFSGAYNPDNPIADIKLLCKIFEEGLSNKNNQPQ